VPAYVERKALVRPRERVRALCLVLLVQLLLGFALVRGLQVQLGKSIDVVERLIEVTVPPVPRPVPPPPLTSARQAPPAAAPKASEQQPGASPAPLPVPAPPSVAPVIPVRPSAAPSGGAGAGSGAAVGTGSGAGAGGYGPGSGDGGGTDLEQIAGEITPRDYPRHLGNAGIGGRVGLLFTVGANGRVTRCAVTRSSGIPELDALTCRLIQQRFRYRPSTDRYGRPVSDEVEGEHVWEAR
jgi:periplasmic protein TonB